MRSPSGHASVVGNGGCCCAGRLLFIVNGCFEAADTFSDSFPEFRKLFRSEDQQFRRLLAAAWAETVLQTYKLPKHE
jgi:hypothetical protein